MLLSDKFEQVSAHFDKYGMGLELSRMNGLLKDVKTGSISAGEIDKILNNYIKEHKITINATTNIQTQNIIENQNVTNITINNAKPEIKEPYYNRYPKWIAPKLMRCKSASCLKLAMFISDNMKDWSAGYFCNQEWIMKHTGMSYSTITRATTTLKKLAIIRVSYGQLGLNGAPNTANHYWWGLPPAFKKGKSNES